MPQPRHLSEFRAMWLVAMFDLPVDTKEARREYTRFRKALLREGFLMLQYSVYARFFESGENADVHRQHVRGALPPAGQVRLLAISDHQFGRMDVFQGKMRAETEEPPPQLMLF
jgi:CRISPR-associated protein Cas2